MLTLTPLLRLAVLRHRRKPLYISVLRHLKLKTLFSQSNTVLSPELFGFAIAMNFSAPKAGRRDGPEV